MQFYINQRKTSVTKYLYQVKFITICIIYRLNEKNELWIKIKKITFCEISFDILFKNTLNFGTSQLKCLKYHTVINIHIISLKNTRPK